MTHVNNTGIWEINTPIGTINVRDIDITAKLIQLYAHKHILFEKENSYPLMNHTELMNQIEWRFLNTIISHYNLSSIEFYDTWCVGQLEGCRYNCIYLYDMGHVKCENYIQKIWEIAVAIGGDLY